MVISTTGMSSLSVLSSVLGWIIWDAPFSSDKVLMNEQMNE